MGIVFDILPVDPDNLESRRHQLESLLSLYQQQIYGLERRCCMKRGDAITSSFIVSDVDTTDTHTFQILTAPSGHWSVKP